jgi:hypothetical protein
VGRHARDAFPTHQKVVYRTVQSQLCLQLIKLINRELINRKLINRKQINLQHIQHAEDIKILLPLILLRLPFNLNINFNLNLKLLLRLVTTS